MTTTNAAIQELATAIGEDPAAIRHGFADWTSLMRQGLIVSLHLRRWRGRTTLDLDDIGVPVNGEQELYAKLLELGQKLLMPKNMLKELDSIDSGARKCVERHGYTTYWGTFIPFTSYQEWKDENQKYQERYYAVRDRLVDNYDSIVDALLDDYAEAARIAYKRRTKLQPGQDFDYRITGEDQFVELFMQRIRQLIPSADQIFDSFAYEVDLTYIPLPSLLAADEEQADLIRSEVIKNRVAIDAAREREAMMTAMHRDVVEEARRQKFQLVNGFLTDIVKQLRSLIYDAVTQIGDATRRNGFLHPRSVVQLNTLIQRVESLNFFGDPDSDRMIAELRRIANQNADDRSPEEIQSILRQIALVTRQSLLTLGDTPRQARSLDVPDVPTVDQVRSARQALGLPTEGLETLPTMRQQRAL